MNERTDLANVVLTQKCEQNYIDKLVKAPAPSTYKLVSAFALYIQQQKSTDINYQTLTVKKFKKLNLQNKKEIFSVAMKVNLITKHFRLQKWRNIFFSEIFF